MALGRVAVPEVCLTCSVPSFKWHLLSVAFQDSPFKPSASVHSTPPSCLMFSKALSAHCLRTFNYWPPSGRRQKSISASFITLGRSPSLRCSLLYVIKTDILQTPVERMLVTPQMPTHWVLDNLIRGAGVLSFIPISQMGTWRHGAGEEWVKVVRSESGHLAPECMPLTTWAAVSPTKRC